MDTHIETDKQSEKPEQNSSAEMVLGFIIIGLLAGSAIGVLKAFSMTSGLDVMLCLDSV